MRTERADRFRALRAAIAVLAALGNFRPGQIRGRFVEHAHVARRFDIFRRGVGQEELIVADARAHAQSRLMPPVLHVARLKLVRRRFQQMRAHRGGICIAQRQHVL